MMSIFQIFSSNKKSPKALHLKSLREALFSEFNGKFTQTKWIDKNAENILKGPGSPISKIVNVFDDEQLKTISSRREGANLDRVIDILKEVQENAPHEKGPFHALDIGWKSTSGQIFSRHTCAPLTCPWLGTANLLRKADTKDALSIFCALAKSVESDQRGARTELMAIALSSPEWAVEAIEKHPKIFVSRKRKFYEPVAGWSQWFGNAFIIMASIPLPKCSLKNCQNILIALEKAGAVCPLGPDGTTVLHLAAAKQTQSCMKAFLLHFPNDRYSSNHLGETPDHVAARNCSTGALAALLEIANPGRSDQSIHPTALNHLGNSALDEAVKAKNVDCVHAICEMGHPSSFDLLRARSWASEEIKSFLDAQIARQEIEKIMGKILEDCHPIII